MKQEWLEIAKNLPCGGKVKVHCCGNSPSMLISHRESGYSTHCFRCNEPDSHAFIPHGQRTIAEIQRHKKELAEFKGKAPRLPSDFTKDIPGKYAWFLKYGVSLDKAKSWGFGWSEFFHRVVIPIYSHDFRVLSAVHMRAVIDGDNPKYLNLGTPDAHACFYAESAFQPNSIVVVEDIISAIKIHAAGYNAVSILGSDITDVQVQRILHLSHNIYVWFDNDKAGNGGILQKKGAIDAIKQFKMQGANVWRVKSLADPKTYNKESIIALMKGSVEC